MHFLLASAATAVPWFALLTKLPLRLGDTFFSISMRRTIHQTRKDTCFTPLLHQTLINTLNTKSFRQGWQNMKMTNFLLVSLHLSEAEVLKLPSHSYLLNPAEFEDFWVPKTRHLKIFVLANLNQAVFLTTFWVARCSDLLPVRWVF